MLNVVQGDAADTLSVPRLLKVFHQGEGVPAQHHRHFARGVAAQDTEDAPPVLL
jgi:hypothetical protein